MTRRRALATVLATLVAVGLVIAVVTSAGSGLAPGAGRHYVALGDSYTAGDGTGVYYRTDPGCYRSPAAYPPLVARRRGYALIFAACSGATTASMVSSQLRSLSRRTSLVTLQIGGNDVGFIGVLETCLLSSNVCASAVATATAAVRTALPAALASTYRRIRSDAPRARVVVLGYPRLFSSAGATCTADLLSSAQERALNRALDLLDQTIAREAVRHGFSFVDPRAAFARHEVCSGSPWINDVTLPLIRSYHPNAAGEAGFAKLIDAVIRRG